MARRCSHLRQKNNQHVRRRDLDGPCQRSSIQQIISRPGSNGGGRSVDHAELPPRGRPLPPVIRTQAREHDAPPPPAGPPGHLVGGEAALPWMRLAPRPPRIGPTPEDPETGPGGRLLHTAVTVSPLGPPRSERGFVVVIDDLTELLRAQKAAAWQEVAQRIAHEIKNPLTPIRLSAERLLRHTQRRAESGNGENDFTAVVTECARLIGQ